ncbi:unnamed protein product [Rotaria socialis]|uniref:Uncharacterized protein n=2 Tax=Rotaria socialis TaxID=392032 RepID=A0A820Z4X5_9BILA|nr:unnamed protein product [Rotaria socialis]
MMDLVVSKLLVIMNMTNVHMRAKLPDTANVAIQIGGTHTQVQERYATKKHDFHEKKDIDDDIQMTEFALQKNVPLELADLGLLATVGPRTIHVYDKLCVVVLSIDSGEIRDSNKIMLVRVLKYTTCYLLSVALYKQFNQLINYHDLRPEYIRVIIVEWSIKFLISIARIISANIQCSLLSARRCENFYDYSQQVD